LNFPLLSDFALVLGEDLVCRVPKEYTQQTSNNAEREKKHSANKQVRPRAKKIHSTNKQVCRVFFFNVYQTTLSSAFFFCRSAKANFCQVFFNLLSVF
jgi:hypothetical protein